jgi:hypothetical protein
MQKVYYFWFNSECFSIPPIFEREVLREDKATFLVKDNNQDMLLYKIGITYSTDKEKIQELWRDYCLETLTNLEGELLDLQRQYCEGPNFQ